MKLRFMFEHAIAGTPKDLHFELAGIWVTGPGPNDLDFLFVPGYEGLEDRAIGIVAEQVENEIDTPADMLERLQGGMPSYLGAHGEIHETTDYDYLPACAKAELKEALATQGRYYPWSFGDAKKA